MSNGVHLRIVASYGQAALQTELDAASGDSFYRIFRDNTGLAVFAYELVVERTSNENEFQLTVRPAGVAFGERYPAIDGGKPTPTISETHKLPPLHSGERTSVDLFKSLQTQDEVIDTIEVSLERNGEAGISAASRPAGLLQFAGLKVYINGSEVTAPGPRGAVAGRYVMFYLPGRGGYFFSAAAPPGHPLFVKAGTIDHDRLKFTLDNSNFEVVTDGAMLIGSAGGEVWVYHDASYRPRGNWTLGSAEGGASGRAPKEFFAAASDSLRWWLP
ncbi:MAG: hypothetical protein ACRD9L_22275 [Bryobacteraceae bacterium]